MLHLRNQLSVWDRKCAWVGLIMIGVTALISHAWYLNQKSELMRLVYKVGLNRTTIVLVMVWFGLLFFFSLIWLFYKRAPWQISRETWVIILSAYTCFSLLWLFGRSAAFYTWFGYRPPPGGINGMLPYFFFVGSSILARCVIPLAIGCGLLKRRIGDFGYRTKGALSGAWIYAGLTAFIVLLVVFFAAEQPAFIKKYPWCKRAIEFGQISGWVFLIYAIGSLCFFFSGESFWRGYLLFGTTRELGPVAMFLMVNIYVLAHFGKPLPETMGAIAAGLVLGALALKHRTFLLGVVCHWTVAMVMDLSALDKRGIEFIW